MRPSELLPPERGRDEADDPLECRMRTDVSPGAVVRLLSCGQFAQIVSLDPTGAWLKRLPRIDYAELEKQSDPIPSQLKVNVTKSRDYEAPECAFELAFFTRRNTHLPEAIAMFGDQRVLAYVWDHQFVIGKFTYSQYRLDEFERAPVPPLIQRRFRQHVADFEGGIPGFLDSMVESFCYVAKADDSNMNNMPEKKKFRLPPGYEVADLSGLWLEKDAMSARSFVKKYSLVMLKSFCEPSEMLAMMRRAKPCIDRYDRRDDTNLWVFNELLKTYKRKRKIKEMEQIREIQSVYYHNFLPLTCEIRLWERQEDERERRERKNAEW